MTNILNHNGYSGTVEFDLENNCLFGNILFVRDHIGYQGENISELKQSFVSAVDEYLDTCAELGKSPDKPFSGSFNIRIEPELHKTLALKAAEKGSSLNSIIVNAISAYLEQPAKQEMNHTHVHKHIIQYCQTDQNQRPYKYNVVSLKSAS